MGATMNHTARWLRDNGSVRASLVDHLRHRMIRSEQIGVTEDHVHQFLIKLIEDDRLASYLSAGRDVKVNALKVWAYQSACTELRGWGTDPSLRASRGTKTERERAAGATWRVRPCPNPASEAITGEGPNTNVVFQFTLESLRVDYFDPSAGTALDTLCQDPLDSQGAHIDRVLKATNHAPCIPVLIGVLQGDTIADLCALHHVSPEAVTAAAKYVGRTMSSRERER